MPELNDDAWWVQCPWCDYDGPEPPIPGLEPLPGHHAVMLCPSCRGRLEWDHGEVARRQAQASLTKTAEAAENG